jgi:hypothetical protein
MVNGLLSCPRLRGLVLLSAAFALPRLALRAQQQCRGCAGEDTVHHTHVLPGVGLRVGAPAKASVALGVVVGEDWQKNGRDNSRNVGLFAEPGLSGGRLSVAYINHGFGSFGSGYAIAATALRTWNDPWWSRENTTYAGGELILWPIVFIGPRVGLFRAVNSPASLTKRWMVTVDFGFGL